MMHCATSSVNFAKQVDIEKVERYKQERKKRAHVCDKVARGLVGRV